MDWLCPKLTPAAVGIEAEGEQVARALEEYIVVVRVQDDGPEGCGGEHDLSVC